MDAQLLQLEQLKRIAETMERIEALLRKADKARTTYAQAMPLMSLKEKPSNPVL